MPNAPYNPVLGFWYRLYNAPTRAEMALEPIIATAGRPYRFQHLVSTRYILDFAFIEDKIAVEVDGPSHSTASQKEIDKLKTAFLEKRGWRVIRISNFNACQNPVTTMNALLEGLGVEFRVSNPIVYKKKG